MKSRHAAGEALGCAALAALCTVSCKAEPAAEPEGAVAVLDGTPIPVEEFERYADAILSFEDEEEPLSGEDLDRVRSRLFDGFIEEEILLFEAQRRGVWIDDAEIDAYLGVAGPVSDEPGDEGDRARHRARRNLMIQKLRGAVVSADSGVTDRDVDAYLAEHRDELEADQQIVLRSLTVGTESSASKVRQQIRAGKIAFAEAIEIHGSASDQGQPMEVGLNDLPREIREAVKELTSGEVSEPVEFQGSVYLFLVDVGPAKLDEERLRERARNELVRTKSQEASERFLDRLRSEITIEIHREALPFTYLPE